jgi:hypothetical protein
MTEAISQGGLASAVVPEFDALRQQGRLPKAIANAALLSAANEACFALVREQPASGELADRIFNLFTAIQPDLFETIEGIKNNPGYASISLSHTVYQVLHGEVPHWDPQTPVGFRMSRGESAIVKRNAMLAEYKTISRGGAYQSIGLPIGGGLYYRLGASTPHSQQTGLALIEAGQMLITTQAIYFGGLTHNFKIPHSSILRLEPFVDGIGVYPDYGSGKVFLPGSLGFADGWFFYNLVSALVAQNT